MVKVYASDYDSDSNSIASKNQPLKLKHRDEYLQSWTKVLGQLYSSNAF